MSRRKSNEVELRTPRAPARSSQDREYQLSSLAFDLVEQRLRAGTASSQETIWALKLGSTREAIEKQKLENENALLATKKEVMDSQKRIEALYEDALNAMRAYAGHKPANNDAVDLDDSNYEVVRDEIVF